MNRENLEKEYFGKLKEVLNTVTTSLSDQKIELLQMGRFDSTKVFL